MGFLETSRFVTLLGLGGFGKTRLALEAAHRVVGEYDDGVWLVRLDNLSDESLLGADIGAVLQMPEAAENEIVDTLVGFVGFVGSKRMMLVLDSCEHLVDAVARLVERLMTDCPRLVVVATSQEALQLKGEQRIPVPPLALPGDEGTPFEDIDASPAVELFMERAAAIDPDIDRSTATLNAVANIVVALDGIPLAIELAAARTDLLTPSEIAMRLADGFDLLDSGARDAPQRQRTLRNTVAWAYDPLGQEEKAIFASLGVFAGGFDAESAAAVGDVSGPDGLDLIGRLLQRSLLTRTTPVAGVSRYRMLETLRHYALERLGDDVEEVRRRHAEHFAARTQDLDSAIMGHDQGAAFATMVAEEDNLRAAIAWSLESGELGPGIRIAARAGRFWDWRGSLAEANTWLQRLADAVADDSYPDLAFMMSWCSYFTAELGDRRRAKEFTAAARAIAETHDDWYGLSVAISGESMYARLDGDWSQAMVLDAELRDLARAHDELWLVAWTHNHDALALLASGDVDEAKVAATTSLESFRALGDQRASAWALTALAQTAHEAGDPKTAAVLASEAVQVSLDAGDGRNAAWAYEIGAEASRASGNSEKAERLKAEAAELLQARGMPFSPWRRSSG